VAEAASDRTRTVDSAAAPQAAASAICRVPPVKEWNTTSNVFISIPMLIGQLARLHQLG
jgi:hypothetical protein